MSPDELQAAADHLRSVGLRHLIPVGEDKRPVIRWRNGAKDYATEEPTDGELTAWAQDPRVHGWAVVGNADTGVCVIDVEPPGVAVAGITEALDTLPPECLRLSVSGGIHAYVIVEGEYPEGLGRIAHAAPAEPGEAPVLLAEVRTAPNYAVVVGPGRPPLADNFAPAVGDRATFDEVIRAIAAAGTYVPEPPQVREYQRTGTGGGTGSIIGDALASGALDPLAVLPEGWEVTGHDRHGRTYVVRPGAESPTSGNVRGGSVVIHSAAVEWAEPGRGYSAAQCLAAARFAGDYAAAMGWVEQAARDLVEHGQAPPDHWPAEVLQAVHEARQQPQADTWEPVTAAEAENPRGWVDFSPGSAFWTAADEPVDYLVPGIVPTSAAVAMFARGGVGKSLLALEWAASLALGLPILGEPVEPTEVLYLDLEQDPRLVLQRLQALGVEEGADLSRLHYSLLGYWKPLDTDEGGRELLAEAVRVGARLVVIDTLSRVNAGDENSADTYNALAVHTMRRLKAAGIAVLRLDHSGKDEAKGQRGSSAKETDVDLIYSLAPAGGGLMNLRRMKNRPNLDGPELLQLRREDGPLRHVPVTVDMIAESKIEAVIAALEAAGLATPDVTRTKAREATKAAGLRLSNDTFGLVRQRLIAQARSAQGPRTGMDQLRTGMDRNGPGSGPSRPGSDAPQGPYIQCPRCDRFMPADQRTGDGCTQCDEEAA